MKFYEDKEEKRLVREIFNWIVDIAVVVIFALFFVYSFGSDIVVSGHSMSPMLKSGDMVLMNRLAYDFKRPGRLDIVVFHNADKTKQYIKRVIGLPGEVIQIKNGSIYINDQLLDVVDGMQKVSIAGLAADPIKLGDHEYFLLGDNRDSSEDSRFSNIGNVNESQIEGKIWMRVMPFDQFGLISSEE